jgi:N-acyl-D-amino-acid deacylase
MSADLLIRGAQVADGDAAPARADVAVRDGAIVAVGPRLDGSDGGEVLHADGLLLCPGFIDMHAHSALEPFRDPRLTPKVAQGFTTELVHPDGLAPAPVAAERRDDRRAYLSALEGPGPDEWGWTTLPEYLDALAGAGPATSLVPSIGHNAVRDLVIGSDARAPDSGELREMRRAVREGFEAGARTLSFGLIYLPGLYALTEELEALAEEAARCGAPLVPHVRNEAGGVLDAVAEFVGIARRTGAPLHLSHLKLVGHEHLLEPLLALLDDAARDVDLTFDQYPYGAGSTVLSALLPPYAIEGGAARTLARVADPAERRRIVADVESGLPGWENLYRACGPERIAIAGSAPPREHDVGRTLAEIADEHGCHPMVAVLDLLAQTRLDVAMVDHYAREEIVRAIFAHPLGLVGSDGIFGARPHPRLYGTAARVLGRWALRDRVVSVQEAVARLTARAADRLGLRDRGRIRPGLRADLVLLDPTDYVDTATYEEPSRPPPGVRAVLVAGTPVWCDGAATGERPGGVVREPLQAT